MIINGVELEDLDILDADVAEKYEVALEKVIQEVSGLKDLKGSQAIRVQCNAVFECFNSLFGDGTNKKVFGERENLLICLKAFEELILQCKEQQKELEKVVNKYSPTRAKRK